MPGNKLGADERLCPRCAETIKAAAVACRFCGAKLKPEAPAGRKSGGGSTGCVVALVVIAGVVVMFFVNGSRYATPREALQTASAPGWLSCIDAASDSFPALQGEILKRLPDPASFRVSRTRATDGPGGAWVEALITFTAREKDGRRIEGSAFGKAYDSSCQISEFAFVCVAGVSGQFGCDKYGNVLRP